MGLFNHFPYPDTHQLNLDWILETVKNCVDKVSELWTFIKEPGVGLDKAVTEAKTAAAEAKAAEQRAADSEQSAQNSAQNAGNSEGNAVAAANTATAKAEQALKSATDAANDASDVRELADGVTTDAANASVSATTARNQATTATQASTAAQESATKCEQALNKFIAAMNKLYPVGAVYVNYRNQAMPVESDATVIARLQALTGGTWARAGSHGQPVTASGQMGWATVNLGNAAGDANDTNFNIYVRTA